jgi:hypothetical protein
MKFMSLLFAGVRKLASKPALRGLKRKCVLFLERLHDRTAILRSMHRRE